MPKSPVKGSNAPKLAYTKLSIRLSASLDQANFKYDISRHRHYSPSNRGGYSPVIDSIIEYGKDNDIAQLLYKRHGIRTSSPTAYRITPKL